MTGNRRQLCDIQRFERMTVVNSKTVIYRPYKEAPRSGVLLDMLASAIVASNIA